MKITRLKLVNFIGIQHGLGLAEFEVDFTKGNNKICMLLGKNGSGKSTIMSQLHPYKDSFDDRKTLILDGCDGRKEIDYQHNGHMYEIVHIYAKSAQSFIKEDGIELNENGGVRTFEDIVSKKLGITKDYFNIGKIGSNAKSFVDFTTAERKNYIGTFLNIDDILEKHKIAADKLKSLKKSIQQIANDLGKYQDKEVIKTEISTLKSSLSDIESEIAQLYQKQGSLDMQIKKLSDEIGTSSVDVLSQNLSAKRLDLSNVSSTIKRLEAEINVEDLNAYKETLQKEYNELQTKIQVNASQQTNLSLLLTDCNNKIVQTKMQLSSLGNPEDLARVIKDIEESETNINSAKSELSKNPQGALVYKAISDKIDVSRYLSKFVDFTDFIEKYFGELSTKSISNEKTNIQYFFDEDFGDTLKRQINEARKAIEAKQTLISAHQKERGIAEGYIGQLKNLEKRPCDCTNDDCPFIKEAVEHRNVVFEIAKLDTELAQCNKDLDVCNLKAENIQNLGNMYQSFQNAYKNVLPRENTVYTAFIKDMSLMDMLNSSLAEFQKNRQIIVSDINDAISCINTILENNRRLVSLNATRKTLEDTDSTLRDTYNKELSEQEDKRTKYNASLTELKTDVAQLNTKISDIRLKIDGCNTLASARLSLTNITNDISELSASLENVEKATNEKALAMSSMNETTLRLSELLSYKNEKQNKLTTLTSALKIVEELNEKKKELDEKYVPISSIEEALSPTKGIPLIFMKNYLGETELIANELLDIAFDGDFKIKFIATEKEFAIQVESKGNTKPDIKMASQGEIAITTISLSLALIEQSIGEYNILCLDEIDGPLDAFNRSHFIDILESQIDKLGIEQVFVISHNNAFDTAAMDLIVLRGAEIDKENQVFMENKTILYDYQE